MKKSALIALFLCYCAMVGSVWVAHSVFEKLPHLEDEMAYLYQAKIFARGDTYVDVPQPLRSYWQPFLLSEDGKRFGKYPPGWPLLLAVGVKLNMTWAINAWIGMLSVALTYRLAREVFNEQTGVVAAALLTISPIALLINGTLMGHTSAQFFTLLFLYGAWQIEKGKHPFGWAAISGMSLGMLVANRPLTAAGVAVPLVIYSGLRVLVALIRTIQRGWSKRKTNKTPARQWLTDENGQVIWWARLVILYIPLTIATGAAYWAVGELVLKKGGDPFWPKWPVLAMGGAIGVAMMAWVVLREPPAEPVENPHWPVQIGKTLRPLLILAVFTVAYGALYPAFNYAVVGDPSKNLYEYVWNYDKIGFGEGHGRNTGGHSWYWAKYYLRKDTVCYSRDLFGWVKQPDNPPDSPTAVSRNDCMVDKAGLSWVLLPLGLFFGWRRRWMWLIALTAGSIIFVTLFYWIGAGVYSARYYYEATALLAIISAAGITGVADMLKGLHLRSGVYMLAALAIGMSLIGYTPERLDKLYRFGIIGEDQIERVDRLRGDDERPVLIIAYLPEIRMWREVGALMALTNPYLDSEYVLARDPDGSYTQALVERFKDRKVVIYRDGTFANYDPSQGQAVGKAPNP